MLREGCEVRCRSEDLHDSRTGVRRYPFTIYGTDKFVPLLPGPFRSNFSASEVVLFQMAATPQKFFRRSWRIIFKPLS